MSKIQHQNRRMRKNLLPIQILIYVSVVCVTVLGYTAFSSTDSKTDTAGSPDHSRRLSSDDRLLQAGTMNATAGANTTSARCGDLLEIKENCGYPACTNDIHGGGMILLLIIGIIYMFAGLAIVCDDYFMSALEEMTEVFNVSPDVAGATFMAAGGSAPELFTSIMGVFFSQSDVGFGTIVGSAVFNVLFVIGLCAIFAKQTLELTWWPLFRDCTYYSISLAILAIFVGEEGEIQLHEAIILFIMYCGYVGMMKYNEQMKDKVEALGQWCGCAPKSAKVVAANGDDNGQDERQDSKSGSRTGNRDRCSSAFYVKDFRSMAVRMYLSPDLMAKQTGRLKKIYQAEIQGNAKFKAAVRFVAQEIVKEKIRQSLKIQKEKMAQIATEAKQAAGGETSTPAPAPEPVPAPALEASPEQEADDDDDDDDDDDGNIFEVPEGTAAKIAWALVLPLQCALFFSIPNCKYDFWKKYYILTFTFSLIWIALFSFCMVWFATIVGEKAGIPDVVMGITFLAAGTSIPDALSSVFVARQGFGDMAVSSSIGSNVFDILVGLPIPWILKISTSRNNILIKSDNILINVLTLLGMVFFVIVSIMLLKWKLDRRLGAIMFLLYLLFLLETLMLEYKCHLGIG